MTRRLQFRLYDELPDDKLVLEFLERLPRTPGGKVKAKEAIVGILADELRRREEGGESDDRRRRNGARKTGPAKRPNKQKESTNKAPIERPAMNELPPIEALEF